jgi:hypothetical protein
VIAVSSRTRGRVFFGLVLAMVVGYVALGRAKTISTWTLTALVVGLVVTSVATDLLLYYRSPRPRVR